MTLFGCKHYWEVVSTDFTPGITFTQSAQTRYPYSYRKSDLVGTTHIYQKCKHCGLIKQYDVAGKYTPDLKGTNASS